MVYRDNIQNGIFETLNKQIIDGKQRENIMDS